MKEVFYDDYGIALGSRGSKVFKLQKNILNLLEIRGNRGQIIDHFNDLDNPLFLDESVQIHVTGK